MNDNNPENSARKQELLHHHGRPFIDWLDYTVPFNKEFFAWITELGDGVDKQGNGFLTYESSFKLKSGSVVCFSEGKQKQGIHIINSAKTLKYLDYAKNLNIDTFISEIYNRWGGWLTRIDLTIDDTIGILNIQEMLKKFKKGEYKGQPRNYSYIDSGKVEKVKKKYDENSESGAYDVDENGNIIFQVFQTGETLYIGSRQTERFFRAYDKAKEEKNFHEHRIRVELEIKGKRAKETGKGFSSLDIPAIFLNYINFIDPKHTRRSNDQTSFFWSEFLGVSEGKKITLHKPDKKLEDVENWAESQLSGALHLLARVNGWDYIEKLIHEGRKKFEKNSDYKRLSEIAGGSDI